MTFIHSEAWPLLSWRGEGGSWCSGAAGRTRRGHRLGRVGPAMGDDLLLLEQRWPPLLAGASSTWRRDMQPRAEGSSLGRAGVIRSTPCKRSHHCLGHAWGSLRSRRARCLLWGWSGCGGNRAPVTLWGRGEGAWAAVPRSTEGLHCSCHKQICCIKRLHQLRHWRGSTQIPPRHLYPPLQRGGATIWRVPACCPPPCAPTHLHPSPVITTNKR